MDPSHRLGELQYAIMRVLWERKEATVAHVQESLEETHPGRAITTVATMLSKMEKKGVVAHRTAGRVFVYRPLVREVDVHRSMVGELTERLFGGDVTALVSHLLTEQEVHRAELERLRRLIARRMEAEKRDPGEERLA